MSRRRWLPADTARALRFADPDPQPGDFTTTYSQVQIAMDADRPGGWMVLLDDVPASYVDLADPRHLEFEYTRWMADLIDELPASDELSVVHLGGAACTLPVYLAVTRPTLRQVIVEYDDKLVDLMRDQFGIRSSRRFSIKRHDALAALRELEDASADIIARDAFGGSLTPDHLRGSEFAQEVRRVLRPGGMYLANIGDRPGMALTREHLQTNRPVFELSPNDGDRLKMAMICDPSVMRGRRYGNVVVAMSDADLPLDGWLDASRRAAQPARVTYAERIWQYL